MKPTILTANAVVFASLMFSAAAVADDPGQDWIPMEKVISVLKSHGYTQISEIEADDGHWEGDGKKNGKNYEFHVDPHSGKITKDEPGD